MAVTIDLDGFDDADRLLGGLSDDGLYDTLRPPIYRGLVSMANRAADYPPPRAGSEYIRGRGYPGRRNTSERLGARWTVAEPYISRITDGLEGRIGNNASYAPWVQSEQFQAWMHRGRWPTDEDIMRDSADGIKRDIEETLGQLRP